MSDYPSPSELFSLHDDVAVVTGGGRGIGEGIARTLAAAGAKVVVAARRVPTRSKPWQRRSVPMAARRWRSPPM